MNATLRFTMSLGPSPAIGVVLLVLACGGCGSANAPQLDGERHAKETPSDRLAEQAPAGAFPVDQILAAIRRQWVFSGDVDWMAAEADVRAKVAAATTDDGRAHAVLGLFVRTNDVHSSLTVRGKSYAHYEALDEPARQRLLPLLAREQSQAGHAVAKILDGHIGYVLVPSIPAVTPEQVTESARQLHEKVCDVARRKPVGWIVDLRLNGGGNLYPMLLGLRPLLGDGGAGGTIDATGRRVQEWVLRPGGLYWRDAAGDRRFVELDMAAEAPDASIPVAVLLGPLTRSSGQATALAFSGRPRCRLIGEPTARGYTTVTAPISFGPDVFLSLSVGFMADRSGKPCKLQVLPDETVEGGDEFDALSSDAKVLAAMRWLRGQTD